MAIDDEVKRKSVAAIASPWMPPVLVPSGSIDGPDRQASGWSYSGIAAEAGGPPAPVDEIERPAGGTTSSFPFMPMRPDPDDEDEDEKAEVLDVLKVVRKVRRERMLVR